MDSVSRNLWGYWDVTLNPDTLDTEIVPLRGVQFKANVTMFLQPPAGSISNLGIHITNLYDWPDTSNLDIDVSLTHPFPGLNMYTGFDVLGVFINDGDTQGMYDNTVSYARTADTARLTNADGYTRWFNPVEFTDPSILGYMDGALGNKLVSWTATINPYKYFCDGIDNDEPVGDFFQVPDNIEDRGLFSTTATNTRQYQLHFPMVDDMPFLTFQYAVVASWEPPVVEPPIIPDDFPISANCTESFHLAIQDNGSTLWYDETTETGGGDFNVTAELFDWGAMYNPSGVLGEFSRIIIESPNVDLYDDYLEFTPADFSMLVQPGTSVSSVADLDLPGLQPTSSDDAEFLLTIETQSDQTYDQGYPMAAPDVQLASYYYFTIPVGDEAPNTFNVISATPNPGESGQFYDTFVIEGEGFLDGPNLAADIMDGTTILASATNISVIDINTINCEFDFCGVSAGDWQLTVTNGPAPVVQDSIDYTIDPDPLKNMDLRPGVGYSDIGVCENTGEPYIMFDDGQLWIYEPDYSDGAYAVTDTNIDRIAVQREGDATAGSTTLAGYGRIYYLPENAWHYAGVYSYVHLDVIAPHNGTRHYFIQNCGSFMGMIRRNIAPSHGGFMSLYTGTGTGAGQVNMSAVVGCDTTHNNVPLTYANQSSWYYILEGAPEYSVERLAYIGNSGNHSFISDGTYLSGPGDGDMELNAPLDIACDYDGNIYILDVLSTGEPIVKVYDYEGTLLGTVGDSTTISGTPLRLDTWDQEGASTLHVAHTNGVSVFRACELPY